jgi:hypothetical protein
LSSFLSLSWSLSSHLVFAFLLSSFAEGGGSAFAFAFAFAFVFAFAFALALALALAFAFFCSCFSGLSVGL